MSPVRIRFRLVNVTKDTCRVMMVRRMLSKRALVGLVAATLCLAILYLYQTTATTYLSGGGKNDGSILLPSKPSSSPAKKEEGGGEVPAKSGSEPSLIYSSPDQGGVCLSSHGVKTDIDTTDVLPTLNFDVSITQASMSDKIIKTLGKICLEICFEMFDKNHQNPPG